MHVEVIAVLSGGLGTTERHGEVSRNLALTQSVLRDMGTYINLSSRCDFCI